MFKLSALIATLVFIYSSSLSGFTLPRFTQGSGDYVLMPLIGYLMIIVLAQIVARFSPQSEQ